MVISATCLHGSSTCFSYRFISYNHGDMWTGKANICHVYFPKEMSYEKLQNKPEVEKTSSWILLNYLTPVISGSFVEVVKAFNNLFLSLLSTDCG